MRTIEEIIVDFREEDMFDCDKRKSFETALYGLMIGNGGLKKCEREVWDQELISLGSMKHEVYGRVKR
jgi:hypothetical protein